MNELEQIAVMGFRIELIYAVRDEKDGGNVWVMHLIQKGRLGCDLEDKGLFSLISRALKIARILNA